jgi:hypothetical protein
MSQPFDIFRIFNDGTRLWLESAPSLEDAKQRVKRLLASHPSDYLIFCHDTQDEILIPARPNASTASAPEQGNQA